MEITGKHSAPEIASAMSRRVCCSERRWPSHRRARLMAGACTWSWTHWRWGPHGWKIMGKHGQTQCVKENRGKYRGVFGSNPVFLGGNMVSNTISNGKILIETHWFIGIVWVNSPFAWRNHGNHHNYTIWIQMGGNPWFYIDPFPFLQERVTKPTKSDVWCPKQSDARNNQAPGLVSECLRQLAQEVNL